MSAPELVPACVDLGMVPVMSGDHIIPVVYGVQYIAVFFNGRLIGRILLGCGDSVASPVEKAQRFVDQLRLMKLGGATIPATTEIVFIKPEQQSGGPCPVIYLSTDAARMLREVKHIGTGQKELIGAMEQVYLEIACVEEDVRKGETTHIETSPANMLSLIASLTPFSDFNQSPRNMYQCQVRASRWLHP